MTTTTPPEENDSPQRERAAGFGVATVRIKPRRAGPLLGRHPWVFDSSIETVDGEVQAGDVVDVVSDKNRFLARGIINPSSRIRVRLYCWEVGDLLDEEFWKTRIKRAIQLRKALGYNNNDGAARVVFSESDGLSGLIVDRYASHLVVQILSLAWARRIGVLTKLLNELLSPQSITFRCDNEIAKAEGIAWPEDQQTGNPPDGPVFIQEHGIRYGVDVTGGQKTGFYLDQRENRRAAASYFAGRRVLDMFCFSGGFSLAASVLGKARQVLGIDASGPAIATAQANAELNAVSNVKFQRRDCFETLDELAANNERFGAVVLDPPKFTRTRRSVNDALRAYHRINRRAVELLAPGGILVTCSCSGNVIREDFLAMLSGVAQKTGRAIQVLEQRGPSQDHPVNPSCPETEYLKCFICRVD